MKSGASTFGIMRDVCARAPARGGAQQSCAGRVGVAGAVEEHVEVLDSLAAGCRFEPAVGGTSEALRVAVLPIREGKCLPGVFAPNGQ